jgi:amino acid transporter
MGDPHGAPHGRVIIMIRGVAISTKVAGAVFAFELAVLVIVALASIISNAGHLSLTPFDPGHFPDPTGRHGQRWWDGSRWTEKVMDGDIPAQADPI